ncbi:MAG: hypothetical protein ACM31C_22355 [Acidobacteriota bacterium]
MRALACVLFASACGRVGFDALAARDGAGDAAADTTPTGTVTWVKVFVGQAVTTGTLTDTWTVAAAHAGDAVVIHVFCESTAAPTAYSITASGWTFTPLSPITGPAGGFYAASAGAIAPDTAATAFAVTWSGTASCTFVDELGDEFTGNDPAGGSVTFGAHAQVAAGTGDCTAALTTPDTNDALWAACTTNCVSAVGPGFTKGADDAHCDWSEHRSSTDAAGTPETVTFATTAQTSYVMTAATIKPR